jgi:hypothetical protein
LAFAGQPAMLQRRQYGNGGVQAGVDIAVRERIRPAICAIDTELPQSVPGESDLSLDSGRIR